MSFVNKVAIITGAGSGIGAACAIALAKQGAKVVLVGRTLEKLEKTKKSITEDKGTALIVQGDVGKEEDVKNVFEKTKTEYSRLDVLIANAGSNGVWAPIDELTMEEYDTTMRTNLRGAFTTVKYAVPLMKERSEGGSIVVVSSINGNRTFTNTGATVYAMTKAAEVAMVKMLAPELAKFKIRINAVCPGQIDTAISANTTKRNLDNIRIRAEYPDGLIPLTGKTPGKTEDVAKTCLFFANDEQSGHVTGTEMYHDGGESLISK